MDCLTHGKFNRNICYDYSSLFLKMLFPFPFPYSLLIMTLPHTLFEHKTIGQQLCLPSLSLQSFWHQYLHPSPSLPALTQSQPLSCALDPPALTFKDFSPATRCPLFCINYSFLSLNHSVYTHALVSLNFEMKQTSS